MPEIRTIRVVNVSDLFNTDELDVFNENNNRWNLGINAMTLAPIYKVRDVAAYLGIMNSELGALDHDIMVDLES